MDQKVFGVEGLLKPTLLAEKREKVLRWLNVGNTSLSHAEACKKRQLGIGSWLIGGTIFKDWKVESSSFLWVHGVQDVLSSYTHQPRTAVRCYRIRGLPECVDVLYEECRGGQQQPRETDLQETLFIMIKDLNDSFLIMDAMDERSEREIFNHIPRSTIEFQVEWLASACHKPEGEECRRRLTIAQAHPDRAFENAN
ncbi:MAG: hypothetical protein M1827_004207 [Pycnora praestabilis]|nr:MAG: hypothetical protein M1827_004207 [Pycnora praestabilis]